MYCKNCGHEIKEGNKFCENCGWQVEMPGTSMKKWVIIGAAIVAAGVIALCLTFAGGIGSDYSKKLEAANQYLEELDYDSAEAAYLELIDLEPGEAEPYQKLTQIYLVEQEYGKAEEILQRAEDAGCGAELESERNAVTSCRSYEEYVSSGSAGEPVPTGVAMSTLSGYLGSCIEDLDGDGAPELVTVSCDYNGEALEGDQFLWYVRGLILTVRICSCENDAVVVREEKTFDCGGYASGSMYWYQCDLFLKKTDKDHELVLTMHGADPNTSYELAKVIPLTGGTIGEPDDAGVLTSWGVEFLRSSNREILYDPYIANDVEKGTDYTEARVSEALEKAKTMYDEAMKPYGMDGKLADDQREWGGKTVTMTGCDQNDPSETYIAYIGMGGIDGKDSEPEESGSMEDRFYVERYTQIGAPSL